MARDQYEYDVGGELRDRYGRVQYVLTQKHLAPLSTDTNRAYTPTDADGRQQIIIQDASGNDLSASIVTNSSAGGPSIYPRLLLDSYYDSALYMHKSDAINAAVAATQALGGTLELRHGRVYILDTATLAIAPASSLKIKGNGATLRANWGKPRCVDFVRTADYQTFQFVELDDLIFDANNLTSTSNQSVVGNLIDGGIGQRINANYIHLRNCRWINVPTGTNSGVSYQCFRLGSAHLASGETQTNLLDIRLENAKMAGGNVGAAVLGSGATQVEVYHDKIYLDVDHDTGVVPSAAVTTTSWANVQIGGNGWGDNCEIHVKGANSGDVGVEIDGMQNSDVYGFVTDARNAAFFVRNFHAPPRPNAQVARFHSCYHRIVNLNPDGSTYNAAGFQLSHTSTPNPAFGTMVLDKCTSDSKATNAAGRAIYVAGPAAKLVTIDCEINQDSINQSLAATQTFTPIYMNPSATDSTSAAVPFTWVNRGGKISVAGTITLNANAFFYRGVWLDLQSSGVDVTLDGAAPLSFSTNLTAAGLTAGSCAHMLVGPSAAPVTPPLVRGEFRFRIKTFAGSDTAPHGAFVQDFQGAITPIINLDADLTFPGCDGRMLPAGSTGREVNVPTQTQNKTTGQFRVLYPALKVAGNAPTAVAQEVSGLVTSPFTYVNRDGRRKMVWLTVSTQAITAVAIGRRSDVTPIVILNQTAAGPYYLDSHDTIKFTFAANSTVTLDTLVAET